MDAIEDERACVDIVDDVAAASTEVAVALADAVELEEGTMVEDAGAAVLCH